MILRMLILVLTLGSSLTSTLFASTERGDRIISEAGGSAGVAGVAGPAGAPGIAGAAGQQGIQGIPGIPGAPGLLDFSDFFALMPGDNVAPIAIGAPVLFPQDGSTNAVIVRNGVSQSSFILPTIGTYLVQFQVSVNEPGQLALRLNGSVVTNSSAGRLQNTCQIVGMSMVTTSAPNAILEVINYDSAAALTITPIAGGGDSVSAHLSIIRIQ